MLKVNLSCNNYIAFTKYAATLQTGNTRWGTSFQFMVINDCVAELMFSGMAAFTISEIACSEGQGHILVSPVHH